MNIRTSIRESRRAIPASYRAAASAKISETILKLDSFKSANKIAAYLAFDGEADPLALMMNSLELNKHVYVPIIVAKNKPLMFSPWKPKIAMRKNKFGIDEPDVPEDQWLTPEELDFVATPLVAFDKKCNRIGVGGGFYDRSFAIRNEGKSAPILVGFAFEMQRVEKVQPEEWDVRLDAVATESNFYGSK